MTTQTAFTLDQLREMLGAFSPEQVKEVLKTVQTEKATLASCTFDAIVEGERAGDLITDNVVKRTTELARAAGLLKPDETATASSVAALMRYADGYRGALARADKKAAAAPAPDSTVPEKSEPDAPAAPEGDAAAPVAGAPYVAPDAAAATKPAKPARNAA